MPYIFNPAELEAYGQNLSSTESKTLAKSQTFLEENYSSIIQGFVKSYLADEKGTVKTNAIQLASILHLTENYVVGRYKNLLETLEASETPTQELPMILSSYFNMATRKYTDQKEFDGYLGRVMYGLNIAPTCLHPQEHSDFQAMRNSKDAGRVAMALNKASNAYIRSVFGREADISFDKGGDCVITMGDEQERTRQNTRSRRLLLPKHMLRPRETAPAHRFGISPDRLIKLCA